MKFRYAFPSLENANSLHQDLLKKFQNTIDRSEVGFFHHTKDKSVTMDAKTMARKFAHKKLLVHVGIGGSSLGPEMLCSALARPSEKKFNS
jgi:glucose-6-phosphate isomerase